VCLHNYEHRTNFNFNTNEERARVAHLEGGADAGEGTAAELEAM